MERLWKAFLNSVRAARRLGASETAFQQEVVLLALALPVGWFLADSWTVYFALVFSVLFILIVEVLNTGIEAACDAISTEFHSEIQLAKDCGSLAVLLASAVAAIIWIAVLVDRFA